LYQAVTREEISTGHHTSTLYREIEEKTTELPALVFLDDIEFLLQNDGDSLLYQLSRTNTDQLNLITTSTPSTNLKDELEERTYSSLHPRRLELEPYNGEIIYQVLVQRSRDSLKPQSVHQNALTYIASTTQNLTYALTWLETTAKKSVDKITEDKVRECREQAYKDCIDKQLREFTTHHRLLIQAIEELEKEEGEPPIQTGEIYQRYHELSESYSEDPVSNRRLSTYLKHLELLQLIESKYHYGGQQGKTRGIRLKH
jgi:Cdc6-like AAA superfamily ATPase